MEMKIGEEITENLVKAFRDLEDQVAGLETAAVERGKENEDLRARLADALEVKGLHPEQVRTAILTERNKYTSFGMHEAIDGILRDLGML